jgi:hypothetical protein
MRDAETEPAVGRGRSPRGVTLTGRRVDPSDIPSPTLAQVIGAARMRAAGRSCVSKPM